MKTRKLLAQTALSISFLIFSSIAIIAAKSKITEYMLQIQSYGTQVYALKDIASTPEGIAQLQQLLEAINPIVQKATILTYAIVPATLFLLWAIFIGIVFYVAEKNNTKPVKYLLIFAAISVIPFSAATYLLLKLVPSLTNFLMLGTEIAWLAASVLLLLAIGYFTFIAYSLIGKARPKNIPLETWRASIKKAYIKLPLFLLESISIIAVISLAIASYLKMSLTGISWGLAGYAVALLASVAITIIIKNNLTRITCRSL